MNFRSSACRERTDLFTVSLLCTVNIGLIDKIMLTNNLLSNDKNGETVLPMHLRITWLRLFFCCSSGIVRRNCNDPLLEKSAVCWSVNKKNSTNVSLDEVYQSLTTCWAPCYITCISLQHLPHLVAVIARIATLLTWTAFFSLARLIWLWNVCVQCQNCCLLGAAILINKWTKYLGLFATKTR